MAPRLYLPGGSIELAIACSGWGLDPKISPSPEDQRPSSNTMCHWTTEVYLPNGIYIRQTV